MDNLTESEEKRLKLIKQIQEMHQQGICALEIARRFQIDRRTVKKYLNGDAEILCRSSRQSNLEQYKNFMLKCLNEGKTQAETTRLVIGLGCDYGLRYIRQYIHSLVIQYQLDINKYISSIHNRKIPQNSKPAYITRKGIFQYLWLNGELTSEHHEYLWNKYAVLHTVEKCIREFREVFQTKKMPLLYLFIDNYKNCIIKEIASFANGLEKDISAVENAVASGLSNGFVEGTNSKLKMVKRTMYGRCSPKLLSAKLMYTPG